MCRQVKNDFDKCAQLAKIFLCKLTNVQMCKCANVQICKCAKNRRAQNAQICSANIFPNAEITNSQICTVHNFCDASFMLCAQINSDVFLRVSYF